MINKRKNVLEPDNSIISFKTYFAKLWVLMLPIAAQNLLLTSLNFIDTLMIGQLGDIPIAAVGIANQIYFLLNLIIFGLASGTAIFTAQFWGAKDFDKIKKVTGIAIDIALIISGIYFLISFLIPEKLLGLFTRDINVINSGKIYLKFVSISFIPMSISFLFSYILRTMHYVKLSLFASFIGVLVNTILNYILIFGIWVFPELGVKGAAFGTIVARFFELLILLYFVYGKKLECDSNIENLIFISKHLLKKFIKVTLPVIFNEMFWSLGVTIYTVIYARIGTEAVAASNIAITIQNFAFILFIGIANASAVIIGNSIGENNINLAHDFAKKGIILSLILGILTGIIIFLLTPLLLSFFKVSIVVKDIIKSFMFIFIFILTFKAENILLIVGIFRSGGDTKFALLIDVGSVWFVGIPFGLVSAFVFKFPVNLVFMFIGMEEVVKFITGYIRFRKGKWIHRVVY